MNLHDVNSRHNPMVIPNFEPKIYGEIKNNGISLSILFKEKIDQWTVHWIENHLRSLAGNEVQYWITFQWAGFEEKMYCKIEVFSENGIWEGTGASKSALSAFKRSLGNLVPAELMETA